MSNASKYFCAWCTVVSDRKNETDESRSINFIKMNCDK